MPNEALRRLTARADRRHPGPIGALPTVSRVRVASPASSALKNARAAPYYGMH